MFADYSREFGIIHLLAGTILLVSVLVSACFGLLKQQGHSKMRTRSTGLIRNLGARF